MSANSIRREQGKYNPRYDGRNRQNNNRQFQRRDKTNDTCFNCEERGHHAFECASEKKPRGQNEIIPPSRRINLLQQE